MGTQPAETPDDEDGIDPLRTRSRTRLLDAAANLLKTGGIEAVTIDAVTKASKVARTTLYRHFNSSSQLLAATFERLLPQVIPPARPAAPSVSGSSNCSPAKPTCSPKRPYKSPPWPGPRWAPPRLTNQTLCNTPVPALCGCV
ncbi:bacterial regulatory s, tetR family protein [Mycobacteroides abscessus subsp. bolletii 1513]|uniref:Bacterial regulatory s, tetR family protein n=1 Tax=Mycobacteroides abscessus subsp. bolletii 1513 TaxID=1299321 RepID=X8DUB6_9MYCO|nr:bacterial regulatory s, tetR family protein [Mycobacteroides abscessus subsp. bolletii 1513]